MAYEIDGKVYRNLQEQVAKNTEHINELSYGNIYKGPYATLDEIPQQELIKGSIFLIGNKTDGYEMYKCLETDNRLYQDLGKFGAMGPKGDKGDKGETGEQGGIGNEGPKGETGNGILRIFLDQVIGQEKHYVIEFTNGDRFSYVVLDGQQGIQGPVGPAGPQGPQGEVGPQGPVANPLYEHNINFVYHYNSSYANFSLKLVTKSATEIVTYHDLWTTIELEYPKQKLMVSGVYETDMSGINAQNPLSYCIVTGNSFECRGSADLLGFHLWKDLAQEYLDSITITDYVRQLI